MYAATPQLMKLVNETLVRDALLARGEASNADLVVDTGLSQTTVKQVLEEMLGRGIVREAGKRSSSGGRRAAAWTLVPDAWSNVAIAIGEAGLSWGIANALGVLTSRGKSPIRTEALWDALDLALDLRGGASALAIGVPGALKDGRIVTGDYIEAWADIELRALFSERVGLPVIVENDLCAIALGYARSLGSGGEAPDSLAYVHFNGGACVGSGLVLDGRVFRGASSYSGELGYLPMGKGRILDEVIGEGASDEDYAEAIVAALRTVNCVVNPGLVALGGGGFRFGLSAAIAERFEEAVDPEVRPGLAFIEDCEPHYLAGLAGLAAELAFPSLRLVSGPRPT